MAVSLNGTNGITFNDSSTQNTAATGFGFKNRIINGAMMIDQRNAGAAVNNTTSGPFSVDRWIIYGTANDKYSAQRSTTAPAGFVNSLLLTSLAATSVGASDRYVIWQKIEGNNIFDFSWGSASAKTITVSFWARSSVTGVYGGCIVNSSGTRSYPFTYSISSADTFEYKTITISGDTSGTWLTDTGIGLYLQLAFGAGSTYSGTAGSWAAANYSSATGATNWISTNGATFYITGVQLEKGSTATSFDYRPYGTELALCQRYCQVQPASLRWAIYAGLNTSFESDQTILTMRATPTVSGQTNSVYGGTLTVTGTTPSSIRYDVATGSATAGKYGAYALGYTLSAEV